MLAFRAQYLNLNLLSEAEFVASPSSVIPEVVLGLSFQNEIAICLLYID